jgi:acyl-CoA synthetase (AMP-forming)/AMP-acid ligase II
MIWSLWLKNKDGVAVIEPGRVWTITEITAAAEQLRPTSPIVPIREPNGAAWLIRFLAAQRIGATALPLDPSSPVMPRVSARGCCVKLTSGTTGKLKPVHCSVRHLINDGRNVCATMGIRRSDRNLALIPFGHSYGLGNLVMPLILQGTPVVCAQTIAPREILEQIRQYNVTVFPTVPAVVRALAALNASKPPSLRLVISAGASLAPEVAQQFYRRFGIKIHNFYGASETGGICYDRTGNATLSGRSVGTPLKNVRVKIRRDGRVVVGRQVLADYGAWNRYGELQLLGRAGLVANIGGKKIAPSEIERALRSVGGVSDAWVEVMKDARGNDFLAAAIESSRTQHELETELRRRVALWQLPKRYFVAGALPRTVRGKLDTVALRARLEPTAPSFG